MKTAHKLLAVALLLLAAPALAQPAAPTRKTATGAQLPKTGDFLFSSACQIMPADDAAGNSIRLTRKADGDELVFGEAQGGTRVYSLATDLVIDSTSKGPSSKISFAVQSAAEKAYRLEPRHFSGTISTTNAELTLAEAPGEPLYIPRVALTYRGGDCPQ